MPIREDRMGELAIHTELTELIAAGEATLAFDLMTKHRHARRAYLPDLDSTGVVDIRAIRPSY